MQKNYFHLKRINFFYIALIIFTCSLPLSEFMVSASSGLLLLTAWSEDNCINKLNRIKQRKLILFMPAIFLIYLISPLITGNGETVVYDLRKALFFIILPLAFLPAKEISSKQKQTIVVLFIGAVLAAVIYALLNWKIFSAGQHLHIHNSGLITHIRFSFQMVMAIWFLIFIMLRNFNFKNRDIILYTVVTLIVITGFLFLQQSLTGIIAFLISIVFVLFISVFSVKGTLKYLFLTGILLIVILPVIYVACIAYPFYFPEKVEKNNLPKTTGNGNYYMHDTENLLIENGKYVYLYVCEDEMREEWNKLSALKYDSLDQYGYTIKSTLLRYLTSKGLTKDAAGVHALTTSDIQNVENGVSNYLFKEKKWPLFSRIYKSVWEFYVYTKLRYVNNQSLSQRIEFSRAALLIIKENFWFGVGPGNWKQAFFDAYKKLDSNLDENYYASSHNQYLNYLVKFGIFGFLLIMFFIIYPVVKSKRYRDPLFLIFLIFMFIANFADSNFESHMGSSFFVFFYCFFLIADGTEYLSFRQKTKPK